jgi:hypothetical protein
VEQDFTRQHFEILIGLEFADEDPVRSVAGLDLIEGQDLIHRFLLEPDSDMDRARNHAASRKPSSSKDCTC